MHIVRLQLSILATAALLLPTGLAQSNYQRLKSFGFPDNSGAPVSLILGQDSRIYGALDPAAIFQINKDGTDYHVLHRFARGDWASSPGPDGNFYGIIPSRGQILKFDPLSGISTVFDQLAVPALPDSAFTFVFGADGAFYGVTEPKSGTDAGSIFKLSSDGSNWTVLRRFSLDDPEGSIPSNLTIAKDGTIFGVLTDHGIGAGGFIFKMKPDGTGFKILRHFAFDESSPGNLVIGSDGAIYGTKRAFHNGRIFRMNSDGTDYRILYELPGIPYFLQTGPDAVLYGVYSGLGQSPKYTLFVLDLKGTNYSELHSWQGIAPGSLVRDNDGVIYGWSDTLFKIDSTTGHYSELRRFSMSGGDGVAPQSDLVVGPDGALYGTTRSGGKNDAGAIFRLSPDGNNYSIIHHFAGGLDGGSAGTYWDGPSAAVTAAPDGFLYGTAPSGGAYDAGTVFKLRPDGSEYHLLYSFHGGIEDGATPQTRLAQGSDGTLYGTTQTGGATNWGTIFRINRDGTEYKLLWSAAASELLLGKDGFIYAISGDTNYNDTVLKLSTDGTTHSILHRFPFANATGGNYPAAGLIQGSDGLLYGITSHGGTSDYGVLFKLAVDGSNYQVLHNFRGPKTQERDGAYPQARLVQASDNTLYGTTTSGGADGDGIAFKIDTDGGNYTILHSFGHIVSFDPPVRDGVGPQTSGLTLAPDGSLYGANWQGGDMGFGTVFRLFQTATVGISIAEASTDSLILALSGGNAGSAFDLEFTPALNSPEWFPLAQGDFGIDGRSEVVAPRSLTSATHFYRAKLK